jgi:hypothetical protein
MKSAFTREAIAAARQSNIRKLAHPPYARAEILGSTPGNKDISATKKMALWWVLRSLDTGLWTRFVASGATFAALGS